MLYALQWHTNHCTWAHSVLVWRQVSTVVVYACTSRSCCGCQICIFIFPRISGETNNSSNGTVPDRSSLWREGTARLDVDCYYAYMYIQHIDFEGGKIPPPPHLPPPHVEKTLLHMYNETILIHASRWSAKGPHGHPRLATAHTTTCTLHPLSRIITYLQQHFTMKLYTKGNYQ